MMSPEPWLLVDCPYMGWRAFHTTGLLNHKGTPTGVLYGFFRSLISIQDTLSISRIAFCFDGEHNKRREILPSYKANRNRDETKLRSYSEATQQILSLRDKHLEDLGYRNIFWREGYEADDVIAALVNQHLGKEIQEAVIVSSDKDLYQLLRPGVWIFNPVKKESITVASFTEEYGMGPDKWTFVKAIAGCDSDNIPGISGVGEITAVKYLKGTCGPAKTAKIKEEGKEVLERNLPLVTLPMPGVGEFSLAKDVVSIKAWRDFCNKFGMDNLLKYNPVGRLPYG